MKSYKKFLQEAFQAFDKSHEMAFGGAEDMPDGTKPHIEEGSHHATIVSGQGGGMGHMVSVVDHEGNHEFHHYLNKTHLPDLDKTRAMHMGMVAHHLAQMHGEDHAGLANSLAGLGFKHVRGD